MSGTAKNERDIWEVSNQLAGFVGPNTPDDLAEFLIRESKAAEALATEITRLRAENAGLREAAKVFEDHYERGICHHESTHRGGSIWTICDDCGAQWADDQGGFKAFEYPPEIVAARAARMPAEGRAALEQEGG